MDLKLLSSPLVDNIIISVSFSRIEVTVKCGGTHSNKLSLLKAALINILIITMNQMTMSNVKAVTQTNPKRFRELFGVFNLRVFCLFVLWLVCRFE